MLGRGRGYGSTAASSVTAARVDTQLAATSVPIPDLGTVRSATQVQIDATTRLERRLLCSNGDGCMEHLRDLVGSHMAGRRAFNTDKPVAVSDLEHTL
jgi:hypothetical protein